MIGVVRIEDDAGSFESDLQEVLSSWTSHREAIPKRWKGDVEPIKAMSHSDLQNHGVEGCYRLVSRARKTMSRLTSLSNTLRELSSAIQAESEAAQENFKVVSNMCNLIFLPNELLARIFRFIVNGNSSLENPNHSREAITLSHVSRYFRSTALSCASLWSKFSGCDSPELDLLCLSRSKDSPLDVALALDFTLAADVDPLVYEMIFEKSLANILPHSERWRSLDIQFVSKPRVDHTVNNDSQLRQSFFEADVRKLESLRLRNKINGPEPIFKGYHEFHHWVTPNLRHLTSVHFFPLSLPDLTNLTSLDITLYPGQIDLVDIHKELSRMKVLESFALNLGIEPRTRSNASQQQSFNKLELARVRTVKIEMGSQGCASIEKLELFFSSLFFPEATSLHVKLSGFVERMRYADDMEATLFLCSEVGCIFQHSAQYPRVERFRLEAIGLNIGPAYIDARQSSIMFTIPLLLLPSLKHFTLRSNGHYQALDSINEKDYKSSTGKPLHTPALETITVQIISFAARSTAWLVKGILTNQTKRSEWDKFRELVVIDDRQANVNGGMAMKVHSGESALDWCKRRGVTTKIVGYFIE
ncbi:hypothetical protein SCHPADRAFT_925357 [Schizopora paradoxa]|uniref:Uncharacterized protein n=1 Tax=Schizopora paradoxa TaxID=27342 RepID=A0A0H2SM84_9AGAM|nr:hypothetical protein SCHPADRAFT_925357 [Schizopora paradoxa]